MSTESWFLLFAAIGAIGGLASVGSFCLQAWPQFENRKPVVVTRRRALSTLALFSFTTLGSCISFFKSVGPDDIPEATMENALVYYWGAALDLGPDYCKVTANGDRFWPWRDKYKFASGCLVYDGLGDPLDAHQLQVSQLHDIRKGREDLLVKWSPSFLEMIQTRKVTSLNYVLMLIPNQINPGSFDTLRQAKAMGVRVVFNAAATISSRVYSLPPLRTQ